MWNRTSVKSNRIYNPPLTWNITSETLKKDGVKHRRKSPLLSRKNRKRQAQILRTQHVSLPLRNGYIRTPLVIASDIFARYKRLCGFNVLNPMGYDAYGLPAEQYAIQTGQHPAVTTQQNITRYREQLDKIGFSFDWSREVRLRTTYYKWTQWAFGKMFDIFL